MASATVAPGQAAFLPMTGRQRWIILASFAAYLVFIAVARSQDPTPTADWIPLLLALYVVLVASPLLLLRRSAGWFHPLVFSSILRLVDLLRRFTMYSWGLDWHSALPAGRDELSELIEYQLLLHSLAVLAHYAGYFFGPRLRTPRISFGPPQQLIPRLLVVWIVAVVAFALFLALQGGLQAHIGRWAEGRHGQFAGQHYHIAVANLGIPVCWIWLAYRPRATRSLVFWAVVAVTLVIAFLLVGSRSTAVYAATVGLMIWMLREGRVAYLRVVALAVVALYVIAALGAFRRSGWYGEPTWENDASVMDSVLSGAQGELADRATSADGAMPIYARVPDEVPLLDGKSYLAVLAMPIPRGIWRDKPTMTDGQVGKIFFGIDAGVPPGGVGEAYWNFHIPGVLLVFFLFGVFHNWLGRTFAQHHREPGMIVLYAAVLLLFRDPSCLTFVSSLISVFPLALILFGVGALRLRRRRLTVHVGPPRAVG